MPSSRRRLTASLVTVLVLTAAGGLCWWGAHSAAEFIEKRSLSNVQRALMLDGKEWATVTTDGLQVHLSGTAPTEVDRFRAMTAASTAVDSSRIIDEMTVAAVAALAPPPLKIELLRNDDGISVIGLIPSSSNRAALIRTLRDETAALQITDLLEVSDQEPPEGWDKSVQFGLRAAQLAPRAKISIEPGAVNVSAITDSREEKGRLETSLTQAVPSGVKLNTEISAPRPVIAPFMLRFLIDEEGPRFDACSADNEDGRDRIIEAAVDAGVDGIPGCTLGLGAPSPQWTDAAVAAIAAVKQLGAGVVTLSDADVALVVPASIEKDAYDAAASKLEQALPDVFSLRAEQEKSKDDQDQGPAEFIATLDEKQKLSMRGRITNPRMHEAVDSLARSRFADVQSNLLDDDAVPSGWTVRVLAAIEALDTLDYGSVQVTPDLIALSGTSGNPEATEAAAAQLADRLGPGVPFELSVRYDRLLDPALNLPDGNECVRQLNIIMSEAEIGFEPNKSSIAGDPEPTLERLAGVMKECRDYQIEAGGHTDAQGSEGFNADLSRGRAQALVRVMQEAGIDTTNMTSRGFGESQPIASNETEAGREENRRIEFRLMSERPVRTETLPPPVTLQGTTAEPPAEDADHSHDEELTPLTDEDILAESMATITLGPIFAGDDMEGPVNLTAAATMIRALIAPPSAQVRQPETEFFGPPIPTAGTSPFAPATVGASEEFLSLEQREANIVVPVQTPDESTPRPSPRPDEVAEEAANE